MEGMMMSRSCALALVCLAMALATVCAQNSPQDYLDGHNAARAVVGVQPLTWDTTVEAYARNYANQRIGHCKLIHSTNPRYGENLYGGPGSGWTAVDAVDSWVSERQWYDYTTNTCIDGKMCGHYTQVVWRDSVSLGCVRVICNNGGTFVICNYSPPGNYVGEKPY